MDKINTTTTAIDGLMHVSNYDKSRVWFNTTTDQGSCRVLLTKAQALKLIDNLKKVTDQVE